MFKHPRLIADKREHYDAERGLHLRVVEKLVQNYLRISVALDLNHHAYAVAVGLVSDIRYILNLFISHEVRYRYYKLGFVHLIRELSV